MISRIWLSMLLTIALTNSASAIVNGPTARGASGLAGVTPAEALLIRQNAVRFIAVFPNQVVKPFCSGIRSGPSEVLTAGHCFSDEEGTSAVNEGRVYAEIYDSTRPNQQFKRRVKVAGVRWQQDSNADLSVVRLDGQMPNLPGIPLATLGCDDESSFFFGGFGLTEKNELSVEVRLSKYSITSSSELAAANGRSFNMANANNFAREWIILSKAGLGHICPGDSGGPLFCRSNGRLSVAGIAASITKVLISKGDRPEREWPGSCQVDFDHAVATRLSGTTEILQKLRDQLEEQLPSSSQN